MAIIRRNPARGVDFYDRGMRRMFDDFLGPFYRDDPAMGNWSPSVDIYETDKDVVVKAEIPGIEQKDLKVDVENNILTIRGERTCETDVKEEDYHRMECQYGSFVRSFSLPATVDADKVQAKFKNGVLKVTLPKREQAKRKQIDISAA